MRERTSSHLLALTSARRSMSRGILEGDAGSLAAAWTAALSSDDGTTNVVQCHGCAVSHADLGRGRPL